MVDWDLAGWYTESERKKRAEGVFSTWARLNAFVCVCVYFGVYRVCQPPVCVCVYMRLFCVYMSVYACVWLTLKKEDQLEERGMRSPPPPAAPPPG